MGVEQVQREASLEDRGAEMRSKRLTAAAEAARAEDPGSPATGNVTTAWSSHTRVFAPAPPRPA